MNKKKCVFCLNYSEDITNDHVFPNSWYPKNSTVNLEKWKVPFCRKCNSELGKIEEDLRLRLGLCLDSDAQESLGIPESVLRSLNAKDGKNEKDIKIRGEKKRKIINEINDYQPDQLENILPNFGTMEGVVYSELKQIEVKPESLFKLSEKIIRGMIFKTTKKFIESDYQISTYICDDNEIPDFIVFMNSYGTTYHRDQAFIFKKAIVNASDFEGLYSIEIWGRLKLYASVLPNNFKI